ncbi:MAG: crotonobetainyl-CoA--carnitine CoA-transferase [Bacteroidetes bacterium]|nr:crotonobetainyl-CoA--carnitine CoA-transferase [Bacteroidota bacterium]
MNQLVVFVKSAMISGFVFILILFSCRQREKSDFHPAGSRTETITKWEDLKFGAFIHFNDNSCVGTEISRNTDPGVFNPVNLDFDTIMSVFKKAGIKYAVLTSRHTSGFCLWDSRFTGFDVTASPYKKDVVRMFVDACRKYEITPCIYYCLWGNDDWLPSKWNPAIKNELEQTTPKEVILGQLAELAQNYGDIYEFWLDMQCWADTSLSVQESYNLIKGINPETIVHFNQHVQDGSKINYFPTDILNGEERTPPAGGHNADRVVNGQQYYLPFEYEITSQRNDSITLGNGLMKGSVWFTYPQSNFYPVDSLYKYIRQSLDRGGSNILLSTAPDKTGTYRNSDRDSLIRLGQLIRKFE